MVEVNDFIISYAKNTINATNLFKYYYKGVLKEKQNLLVIRCPYCGDSRKSIDHAHCYIHKTDNVFYCVRCNTGGSLSRLLYKIKHRFENIDIEKIAYNFSSIQKKNYNILNNKKLLHKTKEDIEYIKSWLLYQNLIFEDDEDIMLLPIARYDSIKKYLKEDNLLDGICYITKGNKVLYRHFYNTKKIRFRTLHLKDNTDNNIRLTVFSTYKIINTWTKYNMPKTKLKGIISESLTDLIAYYNNTKEKAIYIATNGKYSDQLDLFIDKLDALVYLVDSDAIIPEIKFILKRYLNNKKIEIYIPKNASDYRTATDFRIISI